MTDRLVFVGWSHHSSPLDLRERLAFTPERAREAMQGLFSERILVEGAIISTCNRAEIYGLSEREDSFEAMASFFSRFHGVEGDVLHRTAFSGRGAATVRHLLRVAAGLDSLVLGEAQILGQIREAHRVATQGGTARAVTNRLFMAAMECGKRVRTETGLGSRPTSVAGLALSLVGRIFEKAAGLRVLLLGAGETIELTARLLVDEGVSSLRFANRSPDKATALAAKAGGTTVPWDQRVAAMADADLVLSATGSPEPIVLAKDLRRALSKRRGPLLILDLAVPRDVEPAVDELADVYRYDLDALTELASQNTRERQAEVPHAEAIVEDATARFLAWYTSLQHVDVVRELRSRLHEVEKHELERFSGKLAHLSAADRELVSRVAESIVNKILHEPTVGLKEGDVAERMEKAAAARALFKLGGT